MTKLTLEERSSCNICEFITHQHHYPGDCNAQRRSKRRLQSEKRHKYHVDC